MLKTGATACTRHVYSTRHRQRVERIERIERIERK
jgi:hypothetical protein